VDPLFRSLPAVYGANLLTVVMTGMGQDGLRGCQVVQEQGGAIVVQDEASSVVWGMPGYVAEAGLADAVVPLNQIAREIDRRVRDARRLAA
jgi:two-component system chemotaxis response regulator CheB